MTALAVVDVGGLTLDELRRILDRNPFGPHRFLGGTNARSLTDLWFSTFAKQGSDTHFVRCELEGRTVGAAVLRHLAWESNVLGPRVYGIPQLVVETGRTDTADILDLLVARVRALAATLGADTIHCKRLTDDVAGCQALERHGFLIVDTQLVYALWPGDERVVRSEPATDMPCSLRLATVADLDPLIAVARASFKDHFGRFHSDSRLPPGSAQRVYEAWIRSSLAGYADYVALAEVDGRPAAYSVWRRPSARESLLPTRVGHYSIGAVHPDFHRRGLFTAVTRFGSDLLRGAADCIEGPTHVNNYGVQRGYERLGWRIVDATHPFHAWL